MSEQTFGSFISQKRREKGISLRKFAESLGKFPSYICDIEKNRRHPVEREFLLKIAELLSLSDDEKNTLFDLSTQERTEYAPTDISEYINANPMLSFALRRARDAGITDEEWKEIDAYIERMKNAKDR